MTEDERGEGWLNTEHRLFIHNTVRLRTGPTRSLPLLAFVVGWDHDSVWFVELVDRNENFHIIREEPQEHGGEFKAPRHDFLRQFTPAHSVEETKDAKPTQAVLDLLEDVVCGCGSGLMPIQHDWGKGCCDDCYPSWAASINQSFAANDGGHCRVCDEHFADDDLVWADDLDGGDSGWSCMSCYPETKSGLRDRIEFLVKRLEEKEGDSA